MNDIVQSQEKSMEGLLQFLFKVRGLKSKSFRNKERTTNEILWEGGWGFKTKKSHGGNMDIFWNCTLAFVSAKYKLFHFLWKYGQIDKAN